MPPRRARKAPTPFNPSPVKATGKPPVSKMDDEEEWGPEVVAKTIPGPDGSVIHIMPDPQPSQNELSPAGSDSPINLGMLAGSDDELSVTEGEVPWRSAGFSGAFVAAQKINDSQKNKALPYVATVVAASQQPARRILPVRIVFSSPDKHLLRYQRNYLFFLFLRSKQSN